MTAPNRHARRSAAARARAIRRHSLPYERYIKYLPQEPIDAPFEPGAVYHLVHFHDDDCRFYDTENPADCNCNPALARHVEPVRQ
jgi:hypothetical protein